MPALTDQHNLPGVSTPGLCVGYMWPRMATNTAPHKIVNLLNTFILLRVFISVCVFTVWPKTTLHLAVWPRDGCQKVGPP